MKIKKWLGVAALATVAGLALAACGNSEKKADNETVVKIATVNRSGSEEARWDKIQELVKKDGIKLEFTEFTDYSQPNKATADGEVDLNAFQHYNFLNNWNKENGKDLVAIADTYISPIRLYSGLNGSDNKYTKVEDIPANGEIAVPNDATNESRALYLLQSAGLIKLDVSGTALATVANIKENSIAIDSFYYKENIFKYTQLGIECKKGNLDNVKQLLTKGANSKFAKKDDYLIYDALFVSIENRHLPIVKYLVENKADINQIYTEEGLTPLRLARKIGDKEIISYLIKQGAIKFSSDWLATYSGDFLYLKEEKADPRAWGKILVKIDDNMAHLQIETYDKSNDKEYVFKEEKNNEILFVDLKSEDYIKIIKKNNAYFLKSSFLDSLLDENNLYTIEKVISK